MLNKLFKTIQDIAGIDTNTLTEKAQNAVSHLSLSPTAKGLSKLNWSWSEDAMATDKGSGKPLRNWDRQTKLENRLDDIYLSWEKQSTVFEEYLVFIGWQGWPYAIIEQDHPEKCFLPEYVEALAENAFNSVRYFTIKAEEVPACCLMFPASKIDNEFYYVKLVGRTAENTFHDIKGCTLASIYKREKEQLSPIPTGDIPAVSVPKGGRERNSLENALISKAKLKRN